MPKIDIEKGWATVDTLKRSAYKHEQEAGEVMAATLRRVIELEEGIAEHRDQNGDDRCFLDDQQLYALMGDGKLADMTLPPAEVFLESCRRYHASRQPESALYAAQHCPGCTGHPIDLTFHAEDRFEIKDRGPVFTGKLPANVKVRLSDIIAIEYKGETKSYKIVGIETFRPTFPTPENVDRNIGLLVTEVVQSP